MISVGVKIFVFIVLAVNLRPTTSIRLGLFAGDVRRQAAPIILRRYHHHAPVFIRITPRQPKPLPLPAKPILPPRQSLLPPRYPALPPRILTLPPRIPTLTPRLPGLPYKHLTTPPPNSLRLPQLYTHFHRPVPGLKLPYSGYPPPLIMKQPVPRMMSAMSHGYPVVAMPPVKLTPQQDPCEVYKQKMKILQSLAQMETMGSLNSFNYMRLKKLLFE